jgi:hypothetical protein
MFGTTTLSISEILGHDLRHVSPSLLNQHPKILPIDVSHQNLIKLSPQRERMKANCKNL